MWHPKSEEDLIAADEAGTLVEGGHRFELKRELPPSGGKGKGNLELAKDLSSLTIDGGWLVVGINDESDRPPTLTPFPLEKVAERIDQVAATRCDPPVFVEIQTIPSIQSPGLGYIVVTVPPSASAPHMVDGRYWGRDDRTKRVLTDSEVTGFMERRKRTLLTAKEVLDRYIARDPVQEFGEHAHLFGVAVPIAAPQAALLRSLNRDDVRSALTALVFSRSNVPNAYGPSITEAHAYGRRSDGWAFSSFEVQAPGRQFGDPGDAKKLETHLVEVELTEEGIVRVYNGRATDRQGDDAVVILDVLVGGMVRDLVVIAGEVGAHMGYSGQWALGTAIEGPIWGAVSYLSTRGFSSTTGNQYPGESFSELTTATTNEMQCHPGSVSSRLLGRFFRSLAMDRSPEVLKAMGLPDG